MNLKTVETDDTLLVGPPLFTIKKSLTRAPGQMAPAIFVFVQAGVRMLHVDAIEYGDVYGRITLTLSWPVSGGPCGTIHYDSVNLRGVAP